MRHASCPMGQGPSPDAKTALAGAVVQVRGPMGVCPMGMSYLLWHVLCPVASPLSCVPWPCPMSYGPVQCPRALSYVPRPWPMCCPMQLCPIGPVPMASACCFTHRGEPLSRFVELPTCINYAG